MNLVQGMCVKCFQRGLVVVLSKAYISFFGRERAPFPTIFNPIDLCKLK